MMLPLSGQQKSVGPETDGTFKLNGSINPRIRQEDDQGFVDSGRTLSHMALVFRRTPDQQAQLDHLLEELQDPKSPNYRKWLTPEEFGQRFGPSIDVLNRVADWLRSEGFSLESAGRGRGSIIFSGTVAHVRRAFGTEIHNYQVGGKAHFGPATAPSIPAEFATFVGGIRGLDDFHLGPPKRPEPLFTASDGTHALAPGDLNRIYNANGSTAAGIAIAVAGESAIDLADIRQFRSTFQLPPNDPQIVLAGADPGIDRNGPLQEADADLEWVGAIAPDATIIYSYATDAMAASQKIIDDNLAPILVFSFGICEPYVSQSDAIFVRSLAQQANAQGITWIAASGDAGAAACDQGSSQAASGLAVSFPASLPEVTAVGGTNLTNRVQVGISVIPRIFRLSLAICPKKVGMTVHRL